MIARRRRHSGFFLMDTVIGLGVVTILAWILVTAVTKGRRAQDRIDDGNAATQMAQRVLAQLQAGKTAPATLDEAEVVVKPAVGGQAVAGQRWTNVTVTYHGRNASLVGLAPAGGVK